MSDPSTGWWLEEAEPGLVLAHRGGRIFADADQLWLAWLTNNSSDIHGNVDAARSGPFGEPIILGALTAAVVIGLAQPAAPRAPSWGWRPPEWQRITLGRPVRIGDAITASSSITEVKDPDRDWGLVHRLIHGRNQAGEIVVTVDDTSWVPSRRLADKS